MIRGTKRPVPKALKISDVEHLNANLNINIHNRFDVEVIDAKSGKVKQKAQAENVICNQLWTRLLTPQTYFSYIHYGTGNGTPAATDTSLFTFLEYGSISSTNDVLTIDAKNKVASYRRQIQLSETTAVGATLTEVGIGYSTAAASLCTHAMLKDMNGNQISIAKTATDIINIYATVFVHWNPTTSFDGGYIEFTDFGTDTKTFLKYLFGLSTLDNISTLFPLNENNKVIGPQPGNRSRGGGDSVQRSTQSLSVAYSVAEKKLTYTMARAPVDMGNIWPILRLGFGPIIVVNYSSGSYGPYSYGVEYSFMAFVGGSWYPGTDIFEENLGVGDGVTTDFVTLYPLISEAAIKVDGILQTSGVNVDTNKPLEATNMGAYFKYLLDESVSPTGSGSNSRRLPCHVTENIGTYFSGQAVYYNPYYELGLVSYVTSTALVYASNDLVTWTLVTPSISEAYQHHKYWKITNGNTWEWTTNGLTLSNIHFEVAPEDGAVITADYTTKTIAKDIDHVFDFSMTIYLSEYTP